MRWMLEREAATASVGHPTVTEFTTAQGLPLWLCAGTGDASVEPPPPCAPCRGGFVCDEPVGSDSSTPSRRFQYAGLLLLLLLLLWWLHRDSGGVFD